MAKKAQTVPAAETQVLEKVVAPVPPVAPKAVAPVVVKDKAPQTIAEKIAESRKALEHPLEPGQQFFESPEGFIVVAEEGRGHVWCRHSNNGKGSLINPRRA